MRGDDIFYFRAIFSLLEGERIQQNRAVGQGFAQALQLGQMAMRLGQALPDSLNFQAGI